MAATRTLGGQTVVLSDTQAAVVDQLIASGVRSACATLRTNIDAARAAQSTVDRALFADMLTLFLAGEGFNVSGR